MSPTYILYTVVLKCVSVNLQTVPHPCEQLCWAHLGIEMDANQVGRMREGPRVD